MKTQDYTNTINRYGTYIVILSWLLSLLFYYWHFGLITGLEAEKYIREANHFIEHGTLSAPRFWFYSPTIFIIAFSFTVKIGLYGAFIIQALINLCAYLLFFKALKKLFLRPTTPLLIICYLLIFWPYQSWVVYLFTESVYFSAVLILFSVIVLYKPVNFKNVLIIGAALLFTIISRPLGILFAASTYFYFLYIANKKWRIIIACCSVILIFGGTYVINTIFSSIEDWKITQGFEEECIICGWPGTPPYAKLDLATGSPLYQLWYYLSHNFSHFAHFAGIKLRYFFLMTRSYYSSSHNYFLLLNIIPLYLLGLAGYFIKKIKFDRGIVLFITASIILYTICIVFQCDDYHNRFIFSIYPFFVILAARAAEHFVSGFFKNRV